MADRCVIFDLDGTLCDSLGDIVYAVNHLRERHGFSLLSREQVQACVGRGMKNLLIQVLRDTDLTEEAVTAEFKECFADSLGKASALYPGVPEGLKELHNAGYRIALLSNKPQPFCEILLKDYHIATYFDAVAGSAPDRPLKPDPECILALLREMEFKGERSDVFMAGDSVYDMQTASNAGVCGLFAKWGYGPVPDPAPRDSFPDFPAMIQFIRSRT